MTAENGTPQTTFTASEREAVYKAIFARRDVRRFLSAPVPGEAIERILLARITRPR